MSEVAIRADHISKAYKLFDTLMTQIKENICIAAFRFTPVLRESENEDEEPVFEEPKQEKREMTTNQEDIDSYFPSDDENKPQRPAPTVTIHRQQPKVGRNDPCPCGSGKKFKNCCGK